MTAHGEFEPSPVPSDADLPPGELPFTAWGQYEPGMLDLRVFEQDTWWVDREGCPHRLTQMSDDYLHNVIDFLGASVDAFHLAALSRTVVEMLRETLTGVPGVETLACAAGAPTLGDVTPAAWLEGTPLMRSLRRELARRGQAQGR